MELEDEDRFGSEIPRGLAVGLEWKEWKEDTMYKTSRWSPLHSSGVTVEPAIECPRDSTLGGHSIAGTTVATDCECLKTRISFASRGLALRKEMV